MKTKLVKSSERASISSAATGESWYFEESAAFLITIRSSLLKIVSSCMISSIDHSFQYHARRTERRAASRAPTIAYRQPILRKRPFRSGKRRLLPIYAGRFPRFSIYVVSKNLGKEAGGARRQQRDAQPASGTQPSAGHASGKRGEAFSRTHDRQRSPQPSALREFDKHFSRNTPQSCLRLTPL